MASAPAQGASAPAQGASAPVATAAAPADVSHEALELTAEAIEWAPTPATAALARAKAELESQGLLTLGGVGDAFLLGLNAHNGAIEVLSPVSEPSLSYVLPHKDASVRLHWAGSGRAPLPLDRTLPGFQHLGDVTLRIKRKGESRWSTYSTVARAPWTQPACGSESDATRRPTVRVDPSGRFVEADVSGCLLPAGGPLGLRRRVAVHGREASVEWTVTRFRVRVRVS